MEYRRKLTTATRAASMMSPLYVDMRNWELASSWYTEFVPQIQTVIEKGEKSPAPAQGPDPGKLAAELKELLRTIESRPECGEGWPSNVDIFSCDKVLKKLGVE